MAVKWIWGLDDEGRSVSILATFIFFLSYILYQFGYNFSQFFLGVLFGIILLYVGGKYLNEFLDKKDQKKEDEKK